jgi:hypothetical protein
MNFVVKGEAVDDYLTSIQQPSLMSEILRNMVW